MKLIPYLYFKGTAEAALNFYAAAGLGTVTGIARFKDMPPSGHAHAEVSPDWVMNAALTGPEIEMMASDSTTAEPMRGVALTLGMTDLPRARTLFAALSDGGTVTMPLAPQFWGAEFGSFTDRFGVQWQINCEAA